MDANVFQQLIDRAVKTCGSKCKVYCGGAEVAGVVLREQDGQHVISIMTKPKGQSVFDPITEKAMPPVIIPPNGKNGVD